jgi:transcription antitermination protein NusB
VDCSLTLTLPVSPPPSDNQARRLARLAAVQGLYQIALTQRPAQAIIKDFLDHPSTLLQETEEKGDSTAIDQEIFSHIVLGVEQNTNGLDAIIKESCDAKISTGRIEVLLRAILRAGTYELHHHNSIPVGVIINDYVDIARAFFGAKEPGLVNALLDRIAKHSRQP